jgi:hypothetical protein
MFLQHKDKVWRELGAIPLDLLVESLRGHAVKLGKIGVEQHLIPAHHEDPTSNVVIFGSRTG